MSVNVSGSSMTGIQVTLQVFSGIVNPTWFIKPSDQFFTEIHSILQDYRSSSLPSLLGYRGFDVLEITDTDSVRKWTVSRDSNPELEYLLLYTGLNTDDKDTITLVQEILVSKRKQNIQTLRKGHNHATQPSQGGTG